MALQKVLTTDTPKQELQIKGQISHTDDQSTFWDLLHMNSTFRAEFWHSKPNVLKIINNSQIGKEQYKQTNDKKTSFKAIDQLYWM